MASHVTAPKTRTRSLRPSLLESLEGRQFLTGSGFDAQIDFQPAGKTPAGYVADIGKRYAKRSGLKFGWNVDNTAHTRQRHTPSKLRHDTIAFIGIGKSAKTWEIAVPDGLYEVDISAGDPAFADGTHVVQAEGVTVVDRKATRANPIVKGTRQVWVGDGRLTVTTGATAKNVKLGSISVRQLAGAAPSATGAAWEAEPTEPRTLGAWPTGPSTIGLQWYDAAGEAGYIIERSTNGKNFAEVGRVAGNTTSFTASGLKASTKYTFRVKAYNATGTSEAVKFASTKTATATAANVWTPPASTPGNGGATWNGGNGNGGSSGGSTSTPANINKFAMSGLVVNDYNPSTAIPILRDLGIKSVRIWYSVKNWYQPTNFGVLNTAAAYKAAGFSVTMAVVATSPTDEGTVKRFFSQLANTSNARGNVDYWEIGNEPNIGQYWHGSLQQFVTNYMKPAYEVLKPMGETVIGGAISWDANACRQLASYGYNNYCDFAGFHPYGESGDIVVQRARDARAAFGGKPMIITEWNVKNVHNPYQWAAENTKAAAGLGNIAYLNYYYTYKVAASETGAGGLINWDGSRNTPFYNAVRSWLR